MADDPIIEPGYISGLKVVDIGDYRVSRGMTRRNASSCPHRAMVYDPNERRIWCKDCEKDVEAFDAFKAVAEQVSRASEQLRRREERLKEAEAFQIRSLAGKEIDKAWRKRNMVPACPHCGNGLFPEDFKNGVSLVGIEYARARLARKKDGGK